MHIDSQTKAIAEFIGFCVIFGIAVIVIANGIINFLTLNW
jgi:hypothetical protein